MNVYNTTSRQRKKIIQEAEYDISRLKGQMMMAEEWRQKSIIRSRILNRQSVIKRMLHVEKELNEKQGTNTGAD